jgi:hypothetical protein
MFEPQRSWLMTNKKEVRAPLDIHAMRSAYRMKSSEMPGAYEAAARMLMDLRVTLQPGEREVGLLVYRGVDPKTKSFTVEMLLTDQMGEEISFMAAYRKEKKKKK